MPQQNLGMKPTNDCCDCRIIFIIRSVVSEIYTCTAIQAFFYLQMLYLSLPLLVATVGNTESPLCAYFQIASNCSAIGNADNAGLFLVEPLHHSTNTALYHRNGMRPVETHTLSNLPQAGQESQFHFWEGREQK